MLIIHVESTQRHKFTGDDCTICNISVKTRKQKYLKFIVNVYVHAWFGIYIMLPFSIKEISIKLKLSY